MAIATTKKQYICPGETHPISRSVHLSRLAAFYPACRDCPFRTETGSLPKQTVERLQKTEHRVRRASLFAAEGVRGVYLNEIDRSKAGEMAAALVSLLWEDDPPVGRIDISRPATQRHSPAVVVGHDERPSSPDIVTGVVSSIRRMGCQVIDVSVTTKPCFRFTVDHIQAAAGIYVTGDGYEPSWTGLDFVGPEAQPLSMGSGLDRVEDRLREPVSRPTRHAGRHRTFQAFIPYEAGLWKHFHALRPLQIVYSCSTRLVRRTLERIFETLPCRLILNKIPMRARNPTDPDDADVRRLSKAIQKQGADLGLLIDDDGMRVSFLDEEGTLVPTQNLTRLLIDQMLAERPQSTIVVEDDAVDLLQPFLDSSGGNCVAGGKTQASIFQAMREHRGLFGGGTSGRFWFAETFPTTDAVLTLAKVLDLLSRSDTPFSEIVASLSSGEPTSAE